MTVYHRHRHGLGVVTGRQGADDVPVYLLLPTRPTVPPPVPVAIVETLGGWGVFAAVLFAVGVLVGSGLGL